MSNLKANLLFDKFTAILHKDINFQIEKNNPLWSKYVLKTKPIPGRHKHS